MEFSENNKIVELTTLYSGDLRLCTALMLAKPCLEYGNDI